MFVVTLKTMFKDPLAFRFAMYLATLWMMQTPSNSSSVSWNEIQKTSF
jgi:hypothetical protein